MYWGTPQLQTVLAVVSQCMNVSVHARIKEVLTDGDQLWQHIFRWPNIECWHGSYAIIWWIQTSIATKPIALWFFRWVGVGVGSLIRIRACCLEIAKNLEYLLILRASTDPITKTMRALRKIQFISEKIIKHKNSELYQLTIICTTRCKKKMCRTKELVAFSRRIVLSD